MFTSPPETAAAYASYDEQSIQAQQSEHVYVLWTPYLQPSEDFIALPYCQI